MNDKVLTAAGVSLVGCHICGKLCNMKKIPKGYKARCPRCGAKLHSRKPNSLHRTWALVITAFILYIPANIYPVMTVFYFKRGEPDTIISGVVALYDEGLWVIAIIVFLASVFVPLVKLLGLSFLLLSIQFKWEWRPRQRTIMYRSIETIGRWSMLDVFMVSILVALVKLGLFAEVDPGPGITAFAAVVVITIFAAMSFDPRLIWDNDRQPEEQ